MRARGWSKRRGGTTSTASTTMDIAMSLTNMCRLTGVSRDEDVNNSKACRMLGSLEAMSIQGLVLGVNTCGKERPGKLGV